VPQWRQLILEPIIRADDDELMEEDISEGALLRRHARLELDEKRRKRWESQRGLFYF
jgi:male-specific lethal 1